MTTNDRFERAMSGWLQDDAAGRVTDHLDEVLAVTTTTRQRPAWSSLERWLPVDTAFRPRLFQAPRLSQVLLIAALIIALVGALAVYAGSQPHRLPPPFGPARNGLVIFGGSGGDIYELDPLRGAVKALITGGSIDRGPSLAPDGTKFLFLRDTTVVDPVLHVPEPMIMVADADGSEVRQLTGGLANFGSSVWSRSAAWSSDGARVAVASDVDGKPSIRIFTLDGSDQPVVADTHGRTADYLTFRPGDREIVFHGSGSDADGFFGVGADGRGLRTLLEPANADYGSLSPDGTKLAYQMIGGSPFAYGVVDILDVDTGLVAQPAFIPAVSAADDNPSWSPDGTKLLFERYDGASVRMAIAPAAGGAVREIGPVRSQTASGERVGAQFSPDGTKVMAHYDGDGSTWLLDATGSTPDVKLPSSIAETATWQRLAP
jgi:hypothetical protein